MPSMENRCPVCFIPKRGGRRCAYHSEQRARGMTDDYIRESVSEALERNQVIAIVCEAVDDARQPMPFKPKQIARKPKKRRTLTIHGHWAKELCHAVDIGRATASW